MNGVTTLLNFILSLIGDEEAAAAFNNDPEGALGAAGLSDVTAGDVQNLLPLVADYTPALGAHAAGIGAAGLAATNPGAVSPAFADDVTAGGPVEILQTFIQNYTADTINANNIWAGGDVTSAFALGQGAIAAGEEIEGVGQAFGDGSIAAGEEIENVAQANGAGSFAAGGDMEIEDSAIATNGGIAAGDELEIETDGGDIITGNNNAVGEGSTAVGGDQFNVSGQGQVNQAGGDIIHASDDAVVAGGDVNQAQGNGVISGGDTNQASDSGVIAGGDVAQASGNGVNAGGNVTQADQIAGGSIANDDGVVAGGDVAQDDAVVAGGDIAQDDAVQAGGNVAQDSGVNAGGDVAQDGGNIAGGNIVDDNTGVAAGGSVGGDFIVGNDNNTGAGDQANGTTAAATLVTIKS